MGGGGQKLKREARERGREGRGGGGGYVCHHNYQQVDTNKGSTSV